MSEAKPHTAIIAVHDLAHGGAGVGRAEADEGEQGEQRVWFVEGALPGERVRAALDTSHKRWLRGHTVEVVEASAQRVTPPCPLADRCGGCGWQHVDPAAQAALKAGIVDNQLRRLPVPKAVAVASPQALGYRRRARVHYRRVDRGEGAGGATLELGFFGQRSHEIVDAPTCPVLAPELDWAIQQLRSWAAWLPERGEVLGLSNGREVVLGLPGVREQAPLEAAIRAVIEASAAAEDGPRLLGVQLRGGRQRVGVGQTWLELDGDGPLPPVSQGPFTFSQAQAQQNAALVAHVVEAAAAADARVLELHAGVGNFSRALARVARRVWSSDGEREAVANLQRTVERWGLRINPKRAQAERLLAKLAAGEREYAVVVCDPPRAGIGTAAARDLLAVARERIVYVSCDPATLARDLGVLLGEGTGFRCVELRVFDMMPMTPEVEVVATLVRDGAGPGEGGG